MAAALIQHDHLTRAAIESNDGHWVKHTGDGVLAAFSRPGEAIDAAIGVQRNLESADWDGEPVRVRIGIHTGEATVSAGDYFGLAVSAAARITDAANAGQILVSTATHGLIGGEIGDRASFLDLGPHLLKDLSRAQHLFQVVARGLHDSFPPLRSLEPVEHNLPLQLTSFVGRADELAEVAELVARHRLLTVTGVGGSGKTRLSLQAAGLVATDFKHGAWLVDLAALSDPGGVATSLATTLRLRFEEGDALDARERIVDHLRRLELLLILDNCEHLLRPVAEVAGTILASCPEVKILATSREGLGLPGERIWQIPNLDLARGSDAVGLFMERARDVGVLLNLDHAARPAIERICRLLDGMPLAIELAAARARVLSPEQIEERLSDRFRLLTGGSRMALPRQQTLEAAVDWSYQLLTDDERLIFDRLSVFQGGFNLEAAEAVCGEGRDIFAVLDLLTGLVDRSMVTAVTDDGGAARYGMLETLRQFAVRKLADRGTTAAVKGRHASWFAVEADAHNPSTSEDSVGYVWIDQEAANLSAALEWSRLTESIAVAPLATTLGVHHSYTLGDPAEALTLLGEALMAVDSEDEERRAGILSNMLWPLASSGRVEEMVEIAERAVTLARGDIPPPSGAWVLWNVAVRLAQEPDIDTTLPVPLAREAVAMARTVGDRSLRQALIVLAWALLWVDGSYQEIEAVSREAIELAGNDLVARGRALDPLLIATLSLDHERGTDLASAVEDEMIAAYDPSSPQLSSGYLPWIGIRRADWHLADEGIGAVLSRSKGRNRVDGLVPRACMDWMRGSLEEADTLLASIFEMGRVGRWHHDFYPTWAEVACQRGQLDRVVAIVDEHLALDVKAMEEPMKLASLRALTQAHVDAGDLPSAAAAVRKMKGILASHPKQMAGSVQLSTPKGYLACAEAELTRLTGPKPEGLEASG